MSNSIYTKLLKIQGELNVPKSNYNEFGKFNYRSCEDILESLKPILAEHKAIIVITDEIIQIGDRYYIKATAELIDTENGSAVSTTAYAREEETKKGMDSSQITGSASSYARKYALSGLFAIDDTRDADDPSNHEGRPSKKPTKDNRPFPPKASDGLEIRCSGCNTKITQGVATYSEKKYGKKLCVGCQGKQKQTS